MGTVSTFAGIAIEVRALDHNPPHFHAKYQGGEALVAIASSQIRKGELPPKQARLVRQWAREYRVELGRAWSQAKAGLDAERIPGLDRTSVRFPTPSEGACR